MKPHSNVVDLVALDRDSRPSVKVRIERRLEVLRGWLKNGVPTGHSVPKSLTVARRWENEALGIQPIVSPNEFTTTHPYHGKLVRELSSLLTELSKRNSGFAGIPATLAAPPVNKFDERARKQQLENLTSQWHTERQVSVRQRKRADSLAARNSKLQTEIDAKDRLIEELRSHLQLAPDARGLRSVK